MPEGATENLMTGSPNDSYPCYHYLGVTKGMFQFHAWNNWAANHFWFACLVSLSLPLFCFYDISAAGVLITDGLGSTQNCIFGYLPGINGKMDLMQVEQDFSSFFAIFDDFLKFCCDFSLLQLEKSIIIK